VEERIERADRLVAGAEDRPEPNTVRALVWLLAREAPDRVPPVLASVDPWPGRDRTILELLRSGLLPGGEAQALVPLLSPQEGCRDWGTTWLGLRHPWAIPPPDWLTAVATLVIRSRLDPGDPRSAAVRRRLWELQRAETVPELAGAALRGLGVGGQVAGERAARLFLHAYIQPRLGERAPEESWRRYAEMQRALERARSLESERGEAAPEPGEPGADESGSADPKGLLARFRLWIGTWNRRRHRLGEERVHETKGLAILTGMTAIPVLPQFQAVLFGWEDAPQIKPGVAFWVALLSGLVVLANALFLGRYLAWFTSGDRTVRWPVRWMRTALASLSIFGFWTIPAWRWLLAEKEHWLRKAGWSQGGDLPEAPPSMGAMGKVQAAAIAGRLGRWAGRRSVFVTLFLVNLVVLWVAPAISQSIDFLRRPMIVGAFLLHGLFFACMLAGLVLWVRERRFSGWRALALPAFSVCWLVPVPLLPVVGLLGVILVDSELSERSLSHQASGEGRGVRRFADWRRLENRLRRSWVGMDWRRRLRGLPEEARLGQEPTRVERKLLWLFQGKGAALFFEAAWLAGGLSVVSHRVSPEIAKALGKGVVIGLQGLPFFLGALGLVGLSIVFTREILRPATGGRVFGPRLFWGHLVGTQWALFLGLQLGVGLIHSDLEKAGGALVLLGLGGAVLQVGALFVGFLLRTIHERSWETRVEGILKVLVYSGAGTTGLALVRGEPDATQFLAPLDAYQLLAPIFGAVLGFLGLHWLVDPEVRRAFHAGSLPRRDRVRFLLLVITAIAPLGGLAVPWWIRMRQAEWGGPEGERGVASQPPGSSASRSPRSSSPSSLPSR
jgi:hypothetical protein